MPVSRIANGFGNAFVIVVASQMCWAGIQNRQAKKLWLSA